MVGRGIRCGIKRHSHNQPQSGGGKEKYQLLHYHSSALLGIFLSRNSCAENLRFQAYKQLYPVSSPSFRSRSLSWESLRFPLTPPPIKKSSLWEVHPYAKGLRRSLHLDLEQCARNTITRLAHVHLLTIFINKASHFSWRTSSAGLPKSYNVQATTPSQTPSALLLTLLKISRSLTS